MTPSVVLPSPRHNEVGHWKKISVLNGWPAHAAVNASPATLRAACAGCLVAPADASLAVIVVRYSFRCGDLHPLFHAGFYRRTVTYIRPGGLAPLFHAGFYRLTVSSLIPFNRQLID
jgi:hypothetical protein